MLITILSGREQAAISGVAAPPNPVDPGLPACRHTRVPGRIIQLGLRSGPFVLAPWLRFADFFEISSPTPSPGRSPILRGSSRVLFCSSFSFFFSSPPRECHAQLSGLTHAGDREVHFSADLGQFSPGRVLFLAG